MNGVDILIMVAIVIGAAMGFIIGLFRTIVALAALVLATILASQFYLRLGRAIEGVIHSQQAARIASFTIIFGVSFIILIILGLLAYRLVATLSLGMADMIGGALVGVIGALLVVSLCAILLIKYPFANSPELFRQSMLTPYCFKLVELIIRLLPREFSDVIYEIYGEEIHAWNLVNWLIC